MIIINESFDSVMKELEKSGVNFKHGDVIDWEKKGNTYTFEFGECSPKTINKAYEDLKKNHPTWDVNLKKYVEKIDGESYDCYTLIATEKSSDHSGWYIKVYNGNNYKNAKVIKVKNKFDAGMKRQSLLCQYDHADVYEDDDFIDPSEL